MGLKRDREKMDIWVLFSEFLIFFCGTPEVVLVILFLNLPIANLIAIPYSVPYTF